jgi:hypothetical protein
MGLLSGDEMPPEPVTLLAGRREGGLYGFRGGHGH